MHSFKYSSYKAFLNIFFKFIIQKKGGNHWIENVLSVESVYAVKISEPSRQIYWLLNKKKFWLYLEENHDLSAKPLKYQEMFIYVAIFAGWGLSYAEFCDCTLLAQTSSTGFLTLSI